MLRRGNATSAASLTYERLLAELFPRLTGGIRWGLERTQRILAEVGDPHLQYRVVHVGGTNGKGSVAAHVDSVLRHAGHTTGLYTSPHLCTFRERIRILGRAISQAALLDAARRLWPAIERERASFFEATTAIAFLALADAGVGVAVVEVGLGGRLDATNVVDPDVVVLTNVSLDHVQLLGPTIEHVAREKAGIIKAGRPAVTGEADGAALDVFRRRAEELGAPLAVLDPSRISDVSVGVDGTDFTARQTTWGDVRLHTPLAGAHQAHNAALAVAALELAGPLRPSQTELTRGMAHVQWPARLQMERIRGVTWILDVAHNVAGVEALVAAVRMLPLPRPRVAIVGVLGDKDWRNMLTPLASVADRVILTVPPTAPADRRWNPAEAAAAAPSVRVTIVEDFSAALEQAHASVRHPPAGSVLVTGSFHTVGDAMTALGLCSDGSDIRVAAPAFLAGVEQDSA